MRTPRVIAMAAAVAALLSPTSASAQHTRPPDAKLFPYPMTVQKLDNGLTLIVVPMKTPGLMAFYELVRVGSRNEVEKGKSGFAHFFEHMMFRGTKRYSPEARNAFLKKIGADDNGFTTDDFTCYTVFGANSDMAELFEIHGDRIQNLEYGKSEFQTEARAVLGEYNKNFSDPREKMFEKLSAAAFTAHTYRHTTIGFVEDIEAMKDGFGYSRTFFKRYYRPDNTTLVVTGDVDPAAMLTLARKSYGGWGGKAEIPKIPVEPAQSKERRVEIVWNTETNPRIMAAWHTPAEDLTRTDTAVQTVLGELLLGTASPLHRELVLERGLVESLSNWSFSHRDPHLFTILVTLKDEKDREEVWRIVQSKIDELATGKVDADLLADALSNARYSTLTALETPNAVADALVWFSGPNGDPKALEKTLANMEKVTTADVTRFAKEHLTPENRTVVTLKSKQAKPAGGGK